MRDNDEIIRIAAEMQSQIRDGLVKLIQNGAPIGVMHPLIETLDRLERVPSDLAEPRHGEIREISPPHLAEFYVDPWRERALQAEAELQHRVVLAAVGQPPESLAIAEEVGH
ncbi:hypothetical protein NIES2135_21190 [Leptolyngbya boryana NIES-2135]|jgi:hypothetical protein|uniref:Uncharacterized protein n=1 Tax=Leptolyngbya boryana NIES-2135 TaxID=1973484 RepID=A0A1Z4JEY0_LEPBY|nr:MULTISPECIES: hypothetical protein [Leptolyngbya]BAY55296.1 hypothetical protein NIES2135_21190 [Leptolyngbya boryana NIES-2135]MBD2369379.1 hypothetical protein [Leptolyngbya sp. FACHB-161]MBD2375619.1 hypothetical protein [Leptolyngbya sp. FACHB-238]MBD2401708.1 hypothetical protein [Leptolyngbya sp. FACHB-239]MBD2406553.1 hypothetical protein [Leptolyngbya sp. FACHB-402]